MTAPTTSLSQDIYQRVSKAISDGEWLPGERLPSEEALSKRYGVSRPVLRQALAQLRAESRLMSRKGAGHYVCEVNDGHAYDFGALRNVPDVRHFLNFRAIVESEIAADVAEQANPQVLKDLREKMAALEASMARGGPSITEDIAFHLALARGCRNRFLRSALESLTDQMDVATRMNRDLAPSPLPERFRQIASEHRAVVDAIEAGDPQAARQAMHAHLTAGIQRLFGS